MNPWRTGLLLAVVTVSLGGWTWMLLTVRTPVRQSLGLLTLAFVIGAVGVTWRYRRTLTTNLVTANLALGLVVHLAASALVVGGDRLWALGLLGALGTNGHHFAIGVLGIGAATLTWTRARPRSTPTPTPALGQPPEPAPAASPTLEAPPDWDALALDLADDPALVRTLRTLERVAAALDDDPDAARRVLHQEATRLTRVARAEAAEADRDDVLSQAAELLEWGAQKLPELAELDVADVLMGKAIADIRAQRTDVVHRFVDHRHLLAIHPIDRATADAKAEARADAARAALPVLRANGMRLSEELIAADDALAVFRSVTGFQVVAIDDERFVTFEGNGRREALKRAFDEPVHVEVRHYRFADPEVARTIRRRVDRVRRWKGVVDD